MHSITNTSPGNSLSLSSPSSPNEKSLSGTSGNPAWIYLRVSFLASTDQFATFAISPYMTFDRLVKVLCNHPYWMDSAPANFPHTVPEAPGSVGKTTSNPSENEKKKTGIFSFGRAPTGTLTSPSPNSLLPSTDLTGFFLANKQQPKFIERSKEFHSRLQTMVQLLGFTLPNSVFETQSSSVSPFHGKKK
jgi:hypothetical protein